MMTTFLDIRPARPEDAAEIARLSDALGYTATTGEITGRIDAVCSLQGHEVLVAETADGNAVGWIHIFASPRIESAGFVEIGGLVVDERFRRRGVGKRLVAAAFELARRRDSPVVRVRSRTGRRGAHGFYQNLKFRPVKSQQVYEKLVTEHEGTPRSEG